MNAKRIDPEDARARRQSRRLAGIVAAVVLVLDQASKQWVVTSLALGERLEVIPGFFDLTHVTNPGGVWSLGADLAGPLRTALFLALPAAITAFAIWYSWSLPPRARVRQGAIALVVGGAIGNLIDRMFRSPPEVVDFFLAHWRDQRHWPAFNVADSAICVGVGFLLVASFLEDEDEDEDEEDETHEEEHGRRETSVADAARSGSLREDGTRPA